MSPTLAITSIRRAIYGKLSGDTTLNNLLGTPAPRFNKAIYYQLAPEVPDNGFPYVIFNKQSGTPVYSFANGGSAYDEDLWLVKAVDHEQTADDAEAVAQRIDALLTDGALSISGATLMYLRRESDIDYLEQDEGERYQHSGALFRLIFQ